MNEKDNWYETWRKEFKEDWHDFKDLHPFVAGFLKAAAISWMIEISVNIFMSVNNLHFEIVHDDK